MESEPLGPAPSAEFLEEVERIFENPAHLSLRFVDANGAASAHVYVFPEIEGADLYDQVLQRLGQEKHYWYGDDGEYSYASLTATAGGRLELEVPADMPLRVEATSMGDSDGRAEVPVPALAAGESRELVVPLSDEPDRVFWGRLSASGQPVTGARIEVVEYGSTVQTGISPDAEGYFELRARSWRRPQALVRAEGWAPVLVNVLEEHAERSHACSLELRPAATLELVFADAREGELVLSADLPELPYEIEYHLGFLGAAWEERVPVRGGACRATNLPPDVPLRLELNGEPLGEPLGELTLAEGPQSYRWTGAAFEPLADGGK